MRYLQLKAAVERNFPAEVQVARLVPDPCEVDIAVMLPDGGVAPLPKSAVPALRLGAFEVFLCCPEPLAPFGAVELPAWGTAGQASGGAFTAICVASKIQAKAWPAPEAVLRRLVTVMPRIPLKICVRTPAALPVPGVQVEAVTTQVFKKKDTEVMEDAGGQIRLTGVTDVGGFVRFSVPVGVPMRIQVSHEMLMSMQEREVMFMSVSATEDFVADTTLQLWQVEVGDELIVLCSSPRLTPGPVLPEGCQFFQGFVELTSRVELRPDHQGCVRGAGTLLYDIEGIGCNGWRSARPREERPRVGDVETAGNILELVRLSYPIIKVSLVSACCATRLPRAQIAVDGQEKGATDDAGEPVLCGLRIGDHSIEAKHMLAAEGLRIPFSVRSSATCGVQVKVSPKRLRFVCVMDPDASMGAPSGGASGSTSWPGRFADLWLVGGSAEASNFGRGKRPAGEETWMWDGDLCGCGDVLTVNGGILKGPCAAGGQAGALGCCLTKALSSLAAPRGKWHVALNSVVGPGRCIMHQLANWPASSSASEVWLARLALRAPPEEAEQHQGGPLPFRMRFRASCCKKHFSGPSVAVDGAEPIDADEEGCCELPPHEAGRQFKIQIGKVPPCLLPGDCADFTISHGALVPEHVEVQIRCKMWVYWVPPTDDGVAQVDDAMVCVAVDPDHIPDEAQPVRGVIESPNAETEEIVLDGTSTGPFELRSKPGDDENDVCLLAGLKFVMEPPENFKYAAKEPSPFAERCAEVGGCELQRLVRCPVAMGTFRMLPPPAPHFMALRSSCCTRGFCQARVTLNEQQAEPVRDKIGVFKLPRRKVTDSYSGILELLVDGVPGCLLPIESSVVALPYGPEEKETAEVDVRCCLWLYWVPPTDEEMEPPVGTIWLAADKEQVPEGARTVRGTIQCPRSQEKALALDGNSLGPFELSPGEHQVMLHESPCLLADLELKLEPPTDFEFLPELGDGGIPVLVGAGCSLQRLVARPIAVGVFRALPPPPLRLQLRTCCCRRGFGGSRVAVGGEEPLLFADDGCMQLARQRRGGSLQLSFSGVPLCLLPHESDTKLVAYGPKEPKGVDVDILSLLWIYWVPPEAEEDANEESLHDDPEMPVGMLFVTADKEQVPEEALPVSGMLACATAMNPHLQLEGDSIGPFKVRPAKRAPPALKNSDEDTDTESPVNKTVTFVDEERKDDAEEEEKSMACIFGDLRFEMNAPSGYDYRGRNPSPLVERLAELGGCEMQRVAQCPVAVGSFREAPHPMPLRILTRTSCCGRGWTEAQVDVDGLVAKPLIEPGCFRVPPKQRDCRGGVGHLKVKYHGIPVHMLPNGGEECEVNYGPKEPKNFITEVSSLLWVYCVPPGDSEGEEDEEELEEGMEPHPPPVGMVFIAVDKDQIPPEAEPVEGVIRCEGAEDNSITLSGLTMGPFYLRRPMAMNPEDDREEEQCLLSKVELVIVPPTGSAWAARTPSPLKERTCDLGGCELQRLVSCPQVMGYLKPSPRPPLFLSLRTPCCARPFCGAAVKVNKKGSRPFDEEGRLEVARKVNGGSLRMQMETVPQYLLPNNQIEIFENYGPFEPTSINISMTCSVWVYYIPREETGDNEEEEAEPEDCTVWVAIDREQVPDEARAVQGTLLCPGAGTPSIELDGMSIGPFDLMTAEPLPAAEADGGPTCLLAALGFKLEAPDDHVFRARDPSPLAERCEELGGCELQRLMACPVVIGYFSPTPRPPLHLTLRTACCGSAFCGASVAVGSKEAASFDDEGVLEVRRTRAGGDMLLRVEGVPLYLLAGGSQHQALSYGPFEPEKLSLEVECNLWVYWVPPPEEEEEDGDEPAEGTVFVAVDKDQVPDEAVALAGIVASPDLSQRLVLDGTSIGPFALRREATGADGELKCLLASLTFAMSTIEGFEFRIRDPSPLKERHDELGGCELQRLLNSPVAVGFFRPLPIPPLLLTMRTGCCGCIFADATVEVDGRPAVALDEDGALQVKRKRNGGHLALKVNGVPNFLLPGGSDQCQLEYGPAEPPQLDVEVACTLWIYWLPPEEEEEPEEGEEPEPMQTTVWLAIDTDHVPEEAMPIAGTVGCPGAVAASMDLNGTSMGPFHIRHAPGYARGDSKCLLSALDFSGLVAPGGFEFRPRDPSPLLERCEECGGCEMQRLVSGAPSVIGYLKKTDP